MFKLWRTGDHKVYLNDILTAISKIERYVADLSFQEFTQDEMRVDAVIRNLEVIGEAAKHVPEEVRREYPFVEWRKISGPRDIPIHEYFGVDLDILWDIVKNKIPILKRGTKEPLNWKKKTAGNDL